jgi:hypothetical protein
MATRFTLVAMALAVAAGWPAVLAEDRASPQDRPAAVKLDAQTFAPLRQQIKPQPGESRWLEIAWLIDVHEARQKAAAEGKPLFVYSGGGATGIGAC